MSAATPPGEASFRTKAQAKCPSCGRVFRSTGAFDAHHTHATFPECRDPASYGAEQSSTGWTTGKRMSDADVRRLKEGRR